ncbi:glycosyltransferase [Flagellimonas zhangzhouensis]|uniref:Glycosyltransferase involved in cell wall bisynthesis n=1 Tax=Flagellimonas zhangzhouensis TaxID=1073328 RepID=A0A1H2USC7_9FLAO|nr:glycosyltransferase [Allomuricauda zhangzhouensis]SDQ14697.1 Glycosyltransferase involved in cell wall bisynthesis [Allomuricauda zhangzhouensis]SDW58454.1 Glycosyltransferase involved in cell wall bisynthesis [Allomuricauda zhangzhouensis]
MKKALIHDWYYVDGGAEKVIKSFNSVWDDFDHYALVDFLNEDDRKTILNGKTVSTSFIQNLPTSRKGHQKFLQLFPIAIEQFDLKEYDLILSSSASVAKGVLTNQDQLHICYCHSPIRYAWDLYHQYLKESGLDKGLKGKYAKYVLHKIRMWDIMSVNRVDHFIANSNYIARRIKKIYGRESTVIYPPVDTQLFTLNKNKEDYYFTASRMVPYKKMELIIRAFNGMPNKKLIVAGHGPEFSKLNKIAKQNIEFLGFVSEKEIINHLQNAKAFVYAAEEDFGIVPVEAQACGTPIICYAKGGLLETVINGETGVHFYQQTEKAIQNSIEIFERMDFDADVIRKNALRFSTYRFENEIKSFVEKKYMEFKR